jgi:hypothetical protein
VRNAKNSGVIGGILIAAVVISYLLVSPARTEFPPSAGRTVADPSATPTVTMATQAPSPTSAPTSSPAPSPPPTALYVNSTYKFSVMLPTPYRQSRRAVIGDSTPQRYQDAFTARTDVDEASIDTSGCHTACPLWQYVAYVIVNTGIGSQTPRQYYAQQGGSVSQRIEDTLVDGHTAISVTNGVPFPMQFIVKDGDRIFVVAYQLYPPENGMAVPAGATKEKLDSILASFRFTP